MLKNISKATLSKRLNELRKKLEQLNIDAYIIKHGDAHQSEYTAKPDERIKFISGFDGSAGTCVVTLNHALLWTDGRYFIQAKETLGDEWELMKDKIQGTPTISNYLKDQFKNLLKINDPRIALDVWLTSVAENTNFSKDFFFTPVPLEKSLIDEIWGSERPQYPRNEVFSLSTQYTGKSSVSKLAEVRAEMKKKECELLLVSELDSVAWLLNLRGSDISYNPLFISYVIVQCDPKFFYAESSTEDQFLGHQCHLFCDISRFNEEAMASIKQAGVTCHNYDKILSWLQDSLGDKKIWLNQASCSLAIFNTIKKVKPSASAENKVDSPIYWERSPISLLKAVKNSVELEGARECHRRDGLAKTRYLCWLEKQMHSTKIKDLDEVSASKMLAKFRSEQDDFMGLSFEAISSFGPNSAIIHYRPIPEKCRKASIDEIYLVDSGAQFKLGTTDVTRTVHFGHPTEEIKNAFTRVLRGNIALASAVFPPNTTGAALDVLARQYLWKEGMDFGHGTGHGVGAFLCVHEGPQGIHPPRVRMTFSALEPGMIVSNEPGFYKEGHWGIRIEDLMIVRKSEKVKNALNPEENYLEFEVLTLVPIGKNLINLDELTEREIEWVNNYHERVFRNCEKHFMKDDIEWLRLACAPLEAKKVTSKRIKSGHMQQ